MNVGHITSFQPCPQRDVALRISSVELLSAISDPPGAIKASDVVGYDVVEKRRWWRSPLYHLFVRLTGGRSVLFYTAATQFDVALLLDEFEASLPNLPRTWKKA
jgi:hypothetical protein